MNFHYCFQGPKIKQLIIFELTSWIFRTFFIYKSKIVKQDIVLLDIGAGGNYQKGWTHVDFFLLPSIRFWKKYALRDIPEVQMDLRYPIKCQDNIIDGIYSGHTLEHLYPSEAIQLLFEMKRILKAGCWLRINLPDIDLYVN
jgi:predicted SAM-dependent methyltransferase